MTGKKSKARYTLKIEKRIKLIIQKSAATILVRAAVVSNLNAVVAGDIYAKNKNYQKNFFKDNCDWFGGITFRNTIVHSEISKA